MTGSVFGPDWRPDHDEQFGRLARLAYQFRLAVVQRRKGVCPEPLVRVERDQLRLDEQLGEGNEYRVVARLEDWLGMVFSRNAKPLAPGPVPAHASVPMTSSLEYMWLPC